MGVNVIDDPAFTLRSYDKDRDGLCWAKALVR
jgi:hypothetical protein